MKRILIPTGKLTRPLIDERRRQVLRRRRGGSEIVAAPGVPAIVTVTALDLVTATGGAGQITYAGTYAPATPAPVVTLTSVLAGTDGANEAGDTIGTGTFSGVLTGLAPGTYTMRADAPGGATDSIDGITVSIDATAPVASAGTAPASGTRTLGQTIDLLVDYTETVFVVGEPQRVLTIGSTARNATYQAGNGTAQLRFTYTVQTGDLDADDVAVASGVDLNGGTIRDAAGNNADHTGLGADTFTGVLVDGGSAAAESITLTGTFTHIVFPGDPANINTGSPVNADPIDSISNDGTAGGSILGGVSAGLAAGTRPTFADAVSGLNNRRAIQFTSANSQRVVNTTWQDAFEGTATSYTGYLVLLPVTVSGTRGIMCMSGSSGAASTQRITLLSSVNDLIHRRGDGGGTADNATDAGIYTAVPLLVALRFSSANGLELRVNGETAAIDATLASTGALAMTLFMLGARRVSGTQQDFYDGYMAGPWLIAGTRLGDTDHNANRTAIAAHYGITI